MSNTEETEATSSSSSSATSTSTTSSSNNSPSRDSPSPPSCEEGSVALATAAAVDAPDHEHGREPDAPIHKFCSQTFDKVLLQEVMNEVSASAENDDSGGDDENITAGKVTQPDTIDENCNEEQQQEEAEEDDCEPDEAEKRQQQLQQEEVEETELPKTQFHEGLVSAEANPSTQPSSNGSSNCQTVESVTKDAETPAAESSLTNDESLTPNPFDRAPISYDQQDVISPGSKDVTAWLGQLADESVKSNKDSSVHFGDEEHGTENGTGTETTIPRHGATGYTDLTPPSISELSATSAGQRDSNLAGIYPPKEIHASNHPTVHELSYSTANAVSSSGFLDLQQTTSAAPERIVSRHVDLSPTDVDPMIRSSIRSSATGSVADGQRQLPSGYVLAHPEVGIPHMPPLILPQQQGIHPHHQQQHSFHQAGQYSLQSIRHTPTNILIPTGGGKRRVHLRLVEENTPMISHQPERSLFSSFRRRKASINSPIHESRPSAMHSQWLDRGTLTVSWYEGTSSVELQEHVRKSVIRKLGLTGTIKLDDFRVLDESVNPPEEIVLSPFIPNESRLLLRFKTRDAGGDKTPIYGRSDTDSTGPPESPSAAPSPHPKAQLLHGLGLNANQLALLGSRLQGLQISVPMGQIEEVGKKSAKVVGGGKKELLKSSLTNSSQTTNADEQSNQDDKNQDYDDNSTGESNMEVASLHPEDQIQKSLREITELLLSERNGKGRDVPRQEKRQVIFVLANYFVLFLSLIAISAEIQARAPEWHAAMERQLKNVQNCSKDKESLFQCVENGDMAGLVASVLLWISRSAATKRIFLFGFESPKKLWTVVYESLVTAVCWGFSYVFIRRGMNPDTSHRFLQKYWKDAIYGSLAGFNAAFMKQVLKNLIPQEAIEDALQDRQFKLHFLSWLPSFE